MEVLSEAQVALGGLDGGVAERELDLLERRPARVGELGEGAPQVVRRDPDADAVTVGGDRLEDRLRPQRTGPDAAGLRDAAQHRSGVDAGGRGPAIEGGLGPGRHRDGADAAVLADEIDDRPAALSLSDRAEVEPRELTAAQTTAHKHPQQHAVAQAFRGRRVGGFEQLLGLGQRQPVAGPHARTTGASDAQDGGGGNG